MFFFFGIIDYQVACVSIVSIVGIVSVVLGTMVLFGRDLGFMERYSCNQFYFHFIFNAFLKKRVKSMPDLSVFTFSKHLRDRGGGFGGGLCGAHWHIVHGTLPRVVQ